MGIKVGIDLGTTFSAVAIMNEQTGQPVIVPNISGERITPSVIQFTDAGVVVGTEAKEAFEAGEDGCVSLFKRNMGSTEAYCSVNGREYNAEDLSAILLRYLVKETEAVTHQKIEEAVVTVPAYFYHKERGATMRAAKKAGLKVRQIINEPTAAALYYGVKHWRENARVMVYDLGGGTFDVTLVQMKQNYQMESLRTIGNHFLGGKDWDARIVKIIESKIESEIGLIVSDHPEIHLSIMQIAENVKKQLTSRNSVNVNVFLPNFGKFSTTVSLEEFEQSTADLLEMTGNLCKNLLNGLGIGWQDITDILLVGGSTRMRQISSYLKTISGRSPLMHVNPDEAVALGAAIQVHLPLPKYKVLTVTTTEEDSVRSFDYFRFKKREEQKCAKTNLKYSGLTLGKETTLNNVLSMRQTDVVAHAMGVIAVNAEGTHYINKTIVPGNQQIPVKFAEAFYYYTSPHDVNEVEIYVLQGTKSPLESEIIGKYVVSGIKHDRKDNPTTIKIQYSYDVNGMVHVQARQGNGSVDLPIHEEPVPDDMSKFGLPIDPKEMMTKSEGLSVVMALDVSGSMDGEPMEDAQDAMCHFVDKFEDYPGDVRIGVIAFSDGSKIVQSLTDDFVSCKEAIRSIKVCMTGVENEGHPFEEIRYMLKGVQGKRIGIVLADGVWENQPRAVKESHKCHHMDIDIVGIGFGEADKKFLRDISSGDIEAMMVEQSELTRSFGKIAQEIGNRGAGKRGRSGGAVSVATWRAADE